MYANLGPGHIAELDPPPADGVDVLYSHEYVAERMRERNLYGYVGNSPLQNLDPEGLKACKLMIFAGHDFEAVAWAEANEDQFGDGTYAGVVSCGSRGINDAFGDNAIKSIGGTLKTLTFGNLYNALRRAIRKAKDYARSMCDQHKRGKGKDSDCDSVDITVTCSPAAQDIMRRFHGRKPDLCATQTIHKDCPPPPTNNCPE